MEPNPSALKQTTLKPCDGRFAFFVCRGDVITSIQDLANCIQSLNDTQFKTHVNDKKNDFAAWIFNVLKNPFLARDLDNPSNKGDKSKYVKTIRDHCAWLASAA